MRVSDFHFELPDQLIARYPMAERSASRLLVVDPESGQPVHRTFKDIIDYLNPGDLLVLNDTRVIPARLFGRKQSGGKVELLVERVLDEHRVLAHIRASKSPKPGTRLLLDGGLEAVVVERLEALFLLAFAGEQPVLQLLELHGHMPLPPYMAREDEQADWERYQTVYSEKKGAVAAPTAGLHFDQPLLNALEEKGVKRAFVTLHVGAGTFQPVRVDNVEDHPMHSEYLEVSDEVVDAITRTRENGGRVVAVGTTTVRSLETAAMACEQWGQLKPYAGETDIFIYPGFEFQVVDALITNFHLPESTLLMLVCALAGYDQIMNAYRVAIDQQYRFFSYGDAMLLTRKHEMITD